jgi:hypothetical protein
MKPFNLDAALRFDPIVTRDGRKILDFHYFKDAPEGEETIYALVDGNQKYDKALNSYHSDGSLFFGVKNEADLFMAPKVKTYYVNIYEDKAKGIYVASPGVFETEANAKALTTFDKSYVKTIEFEVNK